MTPGACGRPDRPRQRPAHGFCLAFVTALVAVALTASGCGTETPPPTIQVQRNLVTVDNRTPRDWLQVEIWINRQYRVTTPRIAAGSRFSTTLDVFVAGFGQRFDAHRQRVDDLRLTAHEPDGTPVAVQLETDRRRPADR